MTLPAPETAIPSKAHTQQVLKVLWVTLWFNLAIAAANLIMGIFSGVLSLVAEGFHTALDASANIVGIVAIKIGQKPPDHDHPYGHRKFEAMGAIFISFLLFTACLEIFKEAWARFMNLEAAHPEVSMLTYGVVVFSVVVNFLVSKYEHREGRRLENELLVADSAHTMSDVYNGLSILVSLAAIQLGWAWVDLVIALGIVVIIFKTGYSILMRHLGPLVDEAVVDPLVIQQMVLTVDGVESCYAIRSRGMRQHVFLDLHIGVNPDLSVKQAHDIANAVEAKLYSLTELKVKDVMVHVEAAQEHKAPVSV